MERNLKKICFITGTRADYGIMAPVMREIAESGKAQLQIIATNAHLSPLYGMTVNEIEADGFKVDARVDSIVPGGDAKATVLSMAAVEEGIAAAFEELTPDLVVILGDRYEALSAASAAVVYGIQVAHLHGGETTEGAIDDKFRHAITQLSDYHFAATPQYAERIISMGKTRERVWHSGAPGAECQKYQVTGNEYQVTGYGYRVPDFILLAFHPVTLLPDKGESELKAILEALDTFINQGFKILVTMPNSDPGNLKIREMIETWGNDKVRKDWVEMEESLGSVRFHEAMENASAMIGNSSAALIEAPTHRLGAVNVGDRQKGRAHGVTVIDVPYENGKIDPQKIVKALDTVMSMEMKTVLMGMHVASLNPYYKEDAAKFIAGKLLEI